MERIEQKVLLHHGIARLGTVTPAVNAPGSEVSKPGKGEAAAATSAAPAPNAGPNARRGNVRPS